MTDLLAKLFEWLLDFLHHLPLGIKIFFFRFSLLFALLHFSLGFRQVIPGRIHLTNICLAFAAIFISLRFPLASLIMRLGRDVFLVLFSICVLSLLLYFPVKIPRLLTADQLKQAKMRKAIYVIILVLFLAQCLLALRNRYS